MKAAIVRGPGEAPVFADFAEPAPEAGETVVTVTAAAISQVVKSRASGAHYSASSAFPFVAGIDGAGTLDDGRRVYFILPRAPYGSMAEKTVVSPRHCLTLPDGVDDATAAAIAIPGMSSWAAYKERAKLKAGETVLVNGATGTSGRLAIQIAKHLGAGKVIAAARNADALKSLAALGADVTVLLDGDTPESADALKDVFSARVDIVIDYLWGKSAELLLHAAARFGEDAVPIRYVQIGAASGGDITLPSAALRSSALELMGSGIGSIPRDRIVQAIDGVLQAAVPGGFKIAFNTVPLSDVERAWPADDGRRRTVLTI